MRMMNRNKVKIYYALYEGKVDAVDEYGNFTGEKEPQYSNPVALYANVSAVKKGEAQAWQFGDNLNYDRTVALDTDCPPIDEYSVLWVDSEPQLNTDGTLATNDSGEIITPRDHVVKRVAKSLNTVVLAIQKVNVNEQNGN